MAYLEVLDGTSDLDAVYIPEENMAEVVSGIAGDLGSMDGKRRKRGKRRLKRLNQATNKKGGGAVVEVRPHETREMTGKALFERRQHKLDEKIRIALADGDLTISDYTAFSVKLAQGGRTEMFKSGDKEDDGVGNIVLAKLPNNSSMLVTSIFLFSGLGAGTTEEDGKIVDFGKLNTIIANGTFTIKNGQKTFMEKTSCKVFKHEGNAGLLPGEYKLANPILLDGSKIIGFDIDTPAGIPANTFICVELGGVMTVKA